MSFLYFLTGLRNPVLDHLMLAISFLGTPFFVFGLIFWFYINVNKDEACGMIFSFTISCVLAQGIKIVIRAPRPWALGNGDFTPVEGARASSTGYSFPSVHSQSASAFSLSYIYYNKERYRRIAASVYLALVVFSRMYLGVHTPLDVLGGFTLSALVTVIVVHLLRKGGPDASGDGSFLFFLAAISALLIFLGAAFLINGTVSASNTKDAFSTAGLSLGVVIGVFLEHHFIHLSTEGTFLKKVLRFAIALAAGLAINAALKAVFTSHPFFTVLRYGILGLWFTGIVPFLLTKLKLSTSSDPYRPA